MDSNRAQSIVIRRLQPGERLIWHGAPAPWQAALGPLFILAFMTVWTGFAFFWTAMASVTLKSPDWKPPSAFLSIGGLFCLIGVFGWAGALKAVADCWRTAYGLTDRRVVIAVGDSGKTTSFGAAALSNMERTGGEARGTIRFGFGPSGKSYGYNAGLFGIVDPARVEAAIYETLLWNQTKGAAI